MLVDQEEPNDPLEGYEVYLASIEATSATVKPQKVGVTGRSGEVKLPAGDGSLSRLIVMHGGEELTRRPYLPGLRSEVRLRLPSNRQRLELAAEVTAAEDEFLEEIGRLTILGLRLQDSLTKRDLTGAPRIAQELKATAELAPLMNRLGTLEAKINSADEATKSRFGPLIARLKAEADTLKSTIGKLP